MTLVVWKVNEVSDLSTIAEYKFHRAHKQKQKAVCYGKSLWGHIYIQICVIGQVQHGRPSSSHNRRICRAFLLNREWSGLSTCFPTKPFLFFGNCHRSQHERTQVLDYTMECKFTRHLCLKLSLASFGTQTKNKTCKLPCCELLDGVIFPSVQGWLLWRLGLRAGGIGILAFASFPRELIVFLFLVQ